MLTQLQSEILMLRYMATPPALQLDDDNTATGDVVAISGGTRPELNVGKIHFTRPSGGRHCCRVSAADKGCRVYLLEPRPDAVALYSGCTSGKRRAWFLPDDRHTASLVGLRGGWRHARTKVFTRTYESNAAVPGSPKVNRPTYITIVHAQATKSSKPSATTQTDENITKIKCPPFKLLQPSSLPKPNISPYIHSTSASSAQADLLTSSSPIAAISESESVNPIPNNVPSISNISAFPSNSGVQPTSASTSMQDTKFKAKTRARKRKKELLKKINYAIIEIKMAPHKPRKFLKFCNHV
ncbi:uncharacterized protein TNCV_2347651 [Trichonephila clavipes]|nr:uncharacterized protein TNCV_2347651 [Trichonephila clavipes]